MLRSWPTLSIMILKYPTMHWKITLNLYILSHNYTTWGIIIYVNICHTRRQMIDLLITMLPSYQQDFEAMVDAQLITMFSRNLKSFCEVVMLVQDISFSILNAYCLQYDHPLSYHTIKFPIVPSLWEMQCPHLFQPSPPLWSKLHPPSNVMTPKGTKENLKVVLAIEQHTSTLVGVKYYWKKVVSIYDYTPKF